ncbi:hypothetical protein WAI453_011723 [Rhynchosporium graminicola]|uniref:Peptidase S1 domain-containing protein n=1 Tax=Rhynchosporium graminicola TaxID=2792576 RepID=A0A1E1K0G6_9HELO|nr:uncharacterized protein RCO7_07061 [Rhynchosporium commune]
MGVVKRRAPSSDISTVEFDAKTGSSTIEWFFAAKDKYRVVAGTSYPTPWPYDIQRVSDNTRQVINQIRARYEAILIRHNIKLHMELQESISPKNSAKYTDTLLILTLDQDNTTWLAAADEIQDLIKDAVRNQRQGETRIRVELRNQDEMYRDFTSVVRSGTFAHTALLRTVEPILKTAMDFCGRNLTYVTWVMRSGPSEVAEPKPTVMVAVKPGSEDLWHVVDKALKETIEENIGDAVDIELVPGQVLRDASVDLDPRQPKFISKILLPPGSGASIGARSSPDAGSLGPWVYFQRQNGPKIKGFLTCHHVIARGDMINLIANDKNGIARQGRAPLSTITVDYPAPVDARKTKRDLRDEISNGYSVGTNQKMLDRIVTLETAGGLGTVMHSSGHDGISGLDDEQNKMDWAFVRLNNDRNFGQNITEPYDPDDGPVTRAMLGYGSIRVRYDCPGKRITTIGTPAMDAWMAKRGRSSGVTSGFVSAINASCHWTDGTITREIHVANTLAQKAIPMLRPGDSGSMMWNERGEWVGLAIGCTSNDDSAIITAAEKVVEDIRSSTLGGRITLE